MNRKVNIRNVDINQFVKETRDKKIFIFGAGVLCTEICLYLFEYIDREKIVYIIDNDFNKWNKNKKICRYEFEIISPAKMLKLWKHDTVLLIACADVIGVLNQIQNSIINDGIIIYISQLMCSKQFLKSTYQGSFRFYKESKIPKKIHYCWFGSNKVPQQFRRYMETWYKYCPDYEIIEWNENNYDVTKNKYMKQAYEEKKWGFVSDYARLDIVYRYGGIYLDTDVELIASLDDLLYQDGFCGFGVTGLVNLGSGFGATRGLYIVKEMRDYYEKIKFFSRDRILDLTTCIVYQHEILKKYGLKVNDCFQRIEKLSIYPTVVFNGIDPNNKKSNIQNSTRSIHHYEGTWLSEEMKKLRENRIRFLRSLAL